MRVSYLEIYNEQIRDLLQPDLTDLRIHEDKRRGVYVSPLKEEIVTSAKQVMKVIQKGEGIVHQYCCSARRLSSWRGSHSIALQPIAISARPTITNTAVAPTQFFKWCEYEPLSSQQPCFLLCECANSNSSWRVIQVIESRERSSGSTSPANNLAARRYGAASNRQTASSVKISQLVSILLFFFWII